MLKKLAAISLIVGALVLSAPAVASAAPVDTAPLAVAPYPEPPNVTVENPVSDICEASTVVFGANYFAPGESVGVTISGTNAANASYSGNVANADGGLVLSFRPPADGSGSYDIAFNGSRSYTATVFVSHGHDAAVSCDHDPTIAGANTELAITGGEVSGWIVGGGVAALAIGGVLVAAGMARRKRA